MRCRHCASDKHAIGRHTRSETGRTPRERCKPNLGSWDVSPWQQPKSDGTPLAMSFQFSAFVIGAIQAPVILKEKTFRTGRVHRNLVYTLSELGILVGHEHSTGAS